LDLGAKIEDIKYIIRGDIMGLIEYIESGGVIMKLLIVMNSVGIALMVTKVIQLLIYNRNRELHADEILNEFSIFASKDKESAILVLKELLQSRFKRLEKGLPTVKNIATTATLFGLLGTVVGVLMAFEGIAKVGMGDPKIFANGISMALVTTIGGLIVAIIHTVGYNYIMAYLDSVEANLEELIISKIGQDYEAS